MIPRIKHIPTDQELHVMIHEGAVARMGVAAFGIFCYLATKQFFNEPVSLEQMAQQVGMNKKLVQSALDYLVEMGYAE
jgi:AraC-like DNA-binding protein